jgi:ribonuclease P protein component
MPIRSTYCKDERLKREQHIETLFRSGKAFSVFPIRIIWHLVPRGDERYPSRAGFVVPKKKFKHAVDRNRIKRLMREAWRLQKGMFYEAIPADGQLHLFFIYTDVQLAAFEVVEKAVTKGISKLQEAIANAASSSITEPTKQALT